VILLSADGLAGSALPSVALLIGLAALLVAVGWRTVRFVRVRRGINAGLRDADAGVRVAAVLQAAEIGLASTAPALLRAVREERDPAVLAAVVRTVAARQWEPASTSGIVELRLWARAYAAKHPEARPAGQSEPMLPGIAGVVPPPSLDPRRADEFRTRSDQVPDDALVTLRSGHGLPQVSPWLEPDPDPLHPTTVLVTGAGGPAGVAVIRALQAAGHEPVALDADPTAVGLRLTEVAHVVPRYDDPSYLAALVRAATVSSAQALICTVAEEYPALIAAQPYLEESGVRTLMPARGTVEACIDKWAFAAAMSAAGLPGPATNLGSAEGIPGPWIIKPRFGRGSRDVHLVTTATRLRGLLSSVPDPIVQTQLTGREFTADALVNASGAVVSVAPRWRLETKAGISTKGETFDDPEVINTCSLVLKAVGLVGPANVQGFVAEDGDVVVHEVNPRFSGGLPLTLHAGADVVGEYLRMILGLEERPDRLVARPGVRMMRHFTEVFEA
jgi:carbamoyl-phosphate synthase large subunit